MGLGLGGPTQYWQCQDFGNIWSPNPSLREPCLTLSKKLFNIYHLVTMYACFVLHCSRMAFWFIRQRKFDSICIQEKKVVCCVNHVSHSSLWFAHQKNVQSDAFHLWVWERAEELQIEWIHPFETWDPTRPPPTPHPDNVINYATYFSSTYFIKLWWSKICSKSLYRLQYSFPRRNEMLQRFTSFAYLCLKLPTTDPHTETSLMRSNAIKISDSFC